MRTVHGLLVGRRSRWLAGLMVAAMVAALGLAVPVAVAMPESASAATTYEAEAASVGGGTRIDSEHQPFTGTGYANFPAGGGWLQWGAVSGGAGGAATLTIRYANGSGASRTGQLLVNGVTQNITTPATSAWNSWQTMAVPVSLTAGTSNTLRFETTGQDLANIDHITVPGGGQARIILFDGSNLAEWEKTDGSSATWPVSNGYMTVGRGDIRTKGTFGDFRLHVEFWLPNYPPDVTGQARANSGVYLQSRYEIQVLDSFGKPTLTNTDAAAIYAKKAADSNAATVPETWQTYEITFRGARFDTSGNKIENARVTVVWNGTTVHNNVAIDGPTVGGAAEGRSAGPIRLQDHGNPVRYRTIWIEPLN